MLRLLVLLLCLLWRGVCVFVVATRDIAEGEELQTPYGYDYWSHAVDGVSKLEEYMATVGEEEKRLACRVMQPHLRMLGGESG